MTSEVSGDPKSDKMSVDPFSNEVFLSRADYVKAALGTVLLIPLRAVAILVVLGVAWIMAYIGLAGSNEVRIVSHSCNSPAWMLNELMKFVYCNN